MIKDIIIHKEDALLTVAKSMAVGAVKQNAGYAVIESSDFRSALINAVLTQHVPGRDDASTHPVAVDRVPRLVECMKHAADGLVPVGDIPTSTYSGIGVLGELGVGCESHACLGQ